MSSDVISPTAPPVHVARFLTDLAEPRSYTFTAHTILCENCGRTVRIAAEVIALIRAEYDCADQTDAEVAANVHLCITCVDGITVPGERVAEPAPLIYHGGYYQSAEVRDQQAAIQAWRAR